jgi:4-hydroxy-tetrahydrodipicolinate synthase
MAQELIEGSFVAIVTPFNKDGSIDFKGFRDLIDFQSSNGTVALLIMGSTGEVSMLSLEERHAIIRETVKMKTGKMKLFYGCSGASTDAAIKMVAFAEKEGADGAILAAPSYICAPEDDITDYFIEIADSCNLPLGIYNNPPRVKSDLNHEQLLKCFKHPNFVIHKESTTRVGQVAQILKAKPNVAVMCCDSPNLGLVVPTMSLGGHGTANMSGNLAPAEMAKLSTPWRKPNHPDDFRETYLHLLPLLHYTYSAINPVALKPLMQAIGLPSGPLRKPLKPVNPEHLARGVKIMKELGLIEKYGLNASPNLSAAAE